MVSGGVWEGSLVGGCISVCLPRHNVKCVSCLEEHIPKFQERSRFPHLYLCDYLYLGSTEAESKAAGGEGRRPETPLLCLDTEV